MVQIFVVHFSGFYKPQNHKKFFVIVKVVFVRYAEWIAWSALSMLNFSKFYILQIVWNIYESKDLMCRMAHFFDFKSRSI